MLELPSDLFVYYIKVLSGIDALSEMISALRSGYCKYLK